MCGRAVHPSVEMLDYAHRIREEERLADEYVWAEGKMLKEIADLQEIIDETRKQLKHAQQRLHEYRKRRTA